MLKPAEPVVDRGWRLLHRCGNRRRRARTMPFHRREREQDDGQKADTPFGKPTHLGGIVPERPTGNAHQCRLATADVLLLPVSSSIFQSAAGLPAERRVGPVNGNNHGETTMVMTPSTMLPLGTAAPDFSLPSTDGKTIALSDFDGAPALLVMFICNHCPFVKHIRSELARLGGDYQAKGVAVVGISSNDAAAYPDDSPEKMKAEAASAGYAFPYLFDESQSVAKAYQAACTPDFFLFDGSRKLVYRGQLDDSRPDNGIPVTGNDLRAALDAVLAGTAVSAEQKQSVGCNIKWRPGNEPAYFSTS
jgi:peroxiredoxin